MKFALIYKQSFNRTRAKMIDAESREAVTIDLDPSTFWVEHLVDFEKQVVIPVSMRKDGTLIEVPDGEFGEATPAEYFGEQTGTMEL